MFTFAIIDDDKEDLNLIYKFLKEHCDYHHIQYTVDLFNQPFDYSFDKYYDAVFLDIDMPEINGMQLAKQINDKAPTKIIFVTNYDNYINIVFNVRPFHFIRKKELNIEMIKVLTLLFKQLNKEQIRLKTKRGVENVIIDDIYYIEKKDSLTIIHTRDNDYDIWDTISSLYEKLKPYHIEKINQSTLINMKYIKNINNKTITLNNDIRFTLSVRTKTSFLNKYEEYLLRNL